MSVFDASMEPMVDVFLYETTTLLEQLDEILLESEQSHTMTTDSINEIFRIMHTIKGSAAMMGLSAFSKVAHRTEDMFFIVRDDPSIMQGPFSEPIFDILFQASDFFKSEIDAIQQSVEDYQPAESTELTNTIDSVIPQIKDGAPAPVKPTKEREEQPAASETAGEAAPLEEINRAIASAKTEEKPAETGAASGLYRIRVFFEDDCQMENIRAFMLLTQLKDYCDEISSVPENPESNSACSSEIIKNGFLLIIKTSLPINSIYSAIENSVNIKSYEREYEDGSEVQTEPVRQQEVTAAAEAEHTAPAKATAPASKAVEQQKAAPTMPSHSGGKQSMISVNQSKLNQLMDIMGEIVIAESMVSNSPELRNLTLDNFNKSTRQLRKLTDQLQDIVMSIRMVPLTGVFQKMGLIVRDMNRKLGKDVVLETFGGDTEIDKTINDVLADPFMHMIRNSMDHAIESPAERKALGKPEKGVVTLGARNVGGEIVITIEDDGCGLDAQKLIAKARDKGLLTKPESEYSEKEAFGLIMLPGFSTNEVVTEFSGRGVGMDVVRQNIEKVNGTISVDSKKNVGTTFTIKIPLTLAIVDGMELAVADCTYMLPITSIRNSFKLGDGYKVLHDTEGQEMVMVRGTCFPVIRLHEKYGINDAITDLEEGILILIGNDQKGACLFVDKLLGEQQVVVKPFPSYLSHYSIKSNGFAGCTIMGDGSISLILDANNLLSNY